MIKAEVVAMPALLKSALVSALVMIPSVLSGFYLMDHRVPVQYAYFVACSIVLLAVFDFATVIFIEQYRSRLGKMTLPALLGAIAIIFLFIVMESLNRFIEDLGYSFLTPFIAAMMLLISAAVFTEKNTILKIYLGINAIALMLLWAMGASDKIMMPF